MKKKTKCYIYTRVSTAIQVDGYSLDAKKDKLRKYAEFQDMEIVGEYSDEGHSGKNIKGRQEFMHNLIKWVFQDGFIPRGKITKDGNYSIISDYLGTPVEAYDEEGKKVWERNLDIYGRVKTEEALGEKNLIPFRFQGQYEDEETGLYYNRFRYYSPEEGCYTQQDPIRLAGGNPTIYGYVKDVNIWVDVFGLDSFFRSMSREEFFDIQDFGWRASASGMSGKWFADSYEDAIVFGQKMGHGVDTKFYVIEVDIPDYIVDNAFRNPGKHDGIGAASYFEVEDLNQKSVKIKSRNSVRADWKQQVLGRCNG